jgi:hypothetical protein
MMQLLRLQSRGIVTANTTFIKAAFTLTFLAQGFFKFHYLRGAETVTRAYDIGPICI